MEQPKFKVTMAGKTGKPLKPFTVTVANADLIQWDLYRVRKNLPQQDQVGNLWSARICYTAAQREGAIEDRMPWEAFSAQVLNIEYLAADEVDPSPQEAEESS